MRECRPRALARSRSRRTRRIFSAWIAGQRRPSVEITYKPNPVYTDEARNLKLEGEVLLEVEFAANGQLHVNRVVRGLGHGLDEAAIAAANKMRFKPAIAKRAGSGFDSNCARGISTGILKLWR